LLLADRAHRVSETARGFLLLADRAHRVSETARGFLLLADRAHRVSETAHHLREAAESVIIIVVRESRGCSRRLSRHRVIVPGSSAQSPGSGVDWRNTRPVSTFACRETCLTRRPFAALRAC